MFTLPDSIPKPISMKMDPIIMCRTVSTEPTLISILIPVLIPMATVPNLVLISVPIRWNSTHFHCDFASVSPLVGISGPMSFLGGGVSLILGPFSGRGWVCRGVGWVCPEGCTDPRRTWDLTHLPPDVGYGRQASYWNAFLFQMLSRCSVEARGTECGLKL